MRGHEMSGQQAMLGRLKMPRQLEQVNIVEQPQDREYHRSQEHQQQQQQQVVLSSMRRQLEAIRGQVRIVKLHQSEANSRLGFSLRGGKELTGSSVGVFVSHVEPASEAAAKGLQIGDRLIQVNGLDVNQATYEEVVGLVRKAPKSDDILLKVTNLGRIPVQDKSGEPIKWVEVLDLVLGVQQPHSAGVEAGQELNQRRPKQRPPRGPVPVPPTMANSDKLAISSSNGNSSSDEGIGSCDGHRNQEGGGGGCNSLLSDSSSSELLADQAELAVCQATYSAATGKTATMRTNSNSSGGDDSAVSSTLTCSGSSSSSSSVTAASNEAYDCEHDDDDGQCSLSSARSSSSSTATTASNEPIVAAADTRAAVALGGCQMGETLVRVPGGRRTSQAFGCEVVKGPNAWPGIFVQNVKPNSLAERLGLQLGDELARANGHLLSDLSFESAIELIKQLQKQHDELELHVRKGAALEHLASSKQHLQHQHRQQWDNSACEGGGGSNSCLKPTATKTAAATTAAIAPQANEETSEASPLGRLTTTTTGQAASAGKADLRRAPPPPIARSSPAASGPSPSSVAGGCCAAPVKLAATAAARTAVADNSQGIRGSGSNNAGSPATGGAGHPISGTQNQLSGKQEHMNSKPNYNAALVAAAAADVNMKMCAGLSSAPKSSEAAGASSSWLVQRDRSQLAPTGAGDDFGDRAAGCNQRAQLSAEPATSQVKTRVSHQLIGRQQQQEHRLEFREDCLASKTCSRSSTTPTCNSEQGGQSETAEIEQQEELRVEQQSFGGAARMSEPCEPEPEIRIVSQNCSLHHYQLQHSAIIHRSIKQSSFVRKRFAPPHPLAVRLHQQEHPEQKLRLQHQQQQARTDARKAQLVASTAARRQQQTSRHTVDDMRRQLDGRGQSSLLQAHRYVSMDNLASCSPQSQLQRRLRVSPPQTSVAEFDYQAGPSASSRFWLSQRSSSLLGQQAPLCQQQPPVSGGCCEQPGASKTLAARSSHSKESNCLPAPTTAPAQRALRSSCQHNCCSQQQQQAYLQAAGRQYNSRTLGAPLVLARSKAFSMDRLNLLDSNCTAGNALPKIRTQPGGCTRTALGLTRSQQQQIAAVGCSGGASKQLRALVGQRHLLMSAARIGCCSRAALARGQAAARCLSPAVRGLASQQQQPSGAAPATVYRYATTSGFIVAAGGGGSSSSVSGAPSIDPSHSAARSARMRRLCCATKSDQPATGSGCCSAVSKQAPATVYLAAPSACRLRREQHSRAGTSCSRLAPCCSAGVAAPATSQQQAPPMRPSTAVAAPADSCYSSCCAPSAARLPDCCCCCCPQHVSTQVSRSQRHHQLTAGGCELAPTRTAATRKQHQQLLHLSHSKRAPADLSAGATTDSSGYLSAGELGPRAKLCDGGGSAPANVAARLPREPAAQPMVTVCNEDQNRYNNNGGGGGCSKQGQKRDTRQKLTTFLASPSRQAMATTVAATTSYSPGSSPGSGTSASERSSSSEVSSSLSLSGDYANPSADTASSSICVSSSVSPTIIWQQQTKTTALAAPAAAVLATKANQSRQSEHSNSKRHPKVPCPPPLPAPEATTTTTTRLGQPSSQQVAADKTRSAADTFDRSQPVARNRKSADHTSSETEGGGGRQNRLCFVDELKMLSKRQKQHSAVAATVDMAADERPPTESATLIKIINANKLAAAQQRKAAASGCSCQAAASASTGGQRASNSNDSCSLAHNCQKQQQLRLRSSHKSSHEVKSSSSGKLNEEDNKRRQHEMLMKEFKSAHSKMFNKRRGGQQQQATDLVFSPIHQDTGETRPSRSSSPIVDHQLVDNTRQQPTHQTRRSNMSAGGVAKAIGSRKIGLLAQSPVHLAAAN